MGSMMPASSRSHSVGLSCVTARFHFCGWSMQTLKLGKSVTTQESPRLRLIASIFAYPFSAFSHVLKLTS